MALTEFGFFKSIDSNRFVYWIPFFISCFWQGVTAQSTPMKKRENISCPKFGTGLNVRLRPFLAICLASYINILYKTHFEVLKESISKLVQKLWYKCKKTKKYQKTEKKERTLHKMTLWTSFLWKIFMYITG